MGGSCTCFVSRISGVQIPDPASMEDPFLEWLEDQDYWIRDDVIQEQWPDAEFESFVGITKTFDDDGTPMTPRRDLRHHYIRDSAKE